MTPPPISQDVWDLLTHGALHALILGAFVWVLILAVRQGVGFALKRPDWHKSEVGKWAIRLVLQPGLGALLLGLDALAGSYPWTETSWVLEVAVGALAGLQAEIWHQWFGRAMERLLGGRP